MAAATAGGPAAEPLLHDHRFPVAPADGRLDARTPALWLSNGTGRDGRGRRGAPKIGWCWAGNRHTWLGFASAAGRAAVPVPTDENRRSQASVG
ncbi:DUF5701 family protein [Modestobacter sp. KNN46-3]|uniref:DUF5701 family protein n=1 Tax=Modestobacter sp. KNN46-3 TaxID=2711218 RepID=UPI001F1569D3|nr:DUF5701 family protein [Modestobacter sp. KNN46-3]